MNLILVFAVRGGQTFYRENLRVVSLVMAIVCGTTNCALATSYHNLEKILLGKTKASVVGALQGAISISAEVQKLTSYDSYPSSEPAIGIASWYNPSATNSLADQKTASGELYDSNSWAGAIKLELRERFLHVANGRSYRPTYALVEHADKQLIIKINDVGPLKPGRVVDLSERAMRYFDPSLELGLLRNVRITPLPGQDWAQGPVEILKGWCGP